MRFLDLNPLQLTETGAAGQPGLSAFRNGKWLHGQEALAICREDPQAVVFPVWEQLGTDPLELPGGKRHLADLAVDQLRAFLPDPKRDVWALFTPAHWEKEQLRVLLGVTAVLEMDVRVLMPRALVAAPEEPSLNEWQWNQCFRVERSVEAEGLTISACQAEGKGGVLDLFRRQSRAAADWILENHRVDPLYSGKTEQRLFNSWWEWQQGRGEWRYSSDRLDAALSGEKELNLAPVPLAGKIHPEESRLGDLSQPGARYKKFYPLSAG